MQRAILNSLLVDSPHLPRPLATVLAQEVKTLGALDRYEQRALSRRKFAISRIRWDPRSDKRVSTTVIGRADFASAIT
jgi:hypothetical protein